LVAILSWQLHEKGRKRESTKDRKKRTERHLFDFQERDGGWAQFLRSTNKKRVSLVDDARGQKEGLLVSFFAYLFQKIAGKKAEGVDIRIITSAATDQSG